MTTAPRYSDSHFYNDNARRYLLSLKAGVKPDIRPEFGPWEPVVKSIENSFEQTKPAKRIALMPKILESVGKLKQFAHMHLADLLAERDEQQTKTTQQGEALVGMPALPTYAQLSSVLANGACPELEWYEAFSRKASDRAYDQYHQFCGLWLFSVIAGRRTYLEIKKKRFYTNLMIAQCGATSFYAKSFTANIAKQMLQELGLGYALAPNRITPQKLLSDMAGTHVPTNFDDLAPEKQDKIRRKLGMPGQKGLLFDELGLFIQSMLRKNSTNADFAELLMTFDECPKEYESSTIARGGEPIDKPYLTLLGNMTPANLKDNAKQGADFWRDGFWARMSFVVAPPPPRNQEDPGPPQVSEFDDLDLPFPPALMESLQSWHERLGIPVCHLDPKMKGDKIVDGYDIHRAELQETPCTISLEARQAWVNYDHALRQLCLKLPHEDFNGSYVRLAETAMRIAVLLASLSNDNHIELKHWAKAQELTEILRANLHELYAQVNTSEVAPTLTKTIEEKIIAYCEQNEHQEDPDKIPTVRNLSRYTRAATGLLNTVIVDLKRAKLLSERKRGKATYFVPFCESEDG